MSKAHELYDEKYRDRFLREGATPLGKAIYHGRWALVLKHVPKVGVLLDYGSGPGLFNAHGPEGIHKHNFDINPSCGFTTRVWDFQKIEVMTMWDSIEHIPSFYSEIKAVDADWIFLTTPNLESVDKAPILWKHYRPREHLFYFDRHSLEVVMDDLGYQLVEFNFDEGKLRDANKPTAIITGVFKKR